MDRVADLSLATFVIRADTQMSTVTCCCFWTFVGHIAVDWQTLPKVFGVTVEPRDGNVGFRKNKTVSMKISGKVLPGGPREGNMELKLTDWMSWQELQESELCHPGDVIGVDRGAFRVSTRPNDTR